MEPASLDAACQTRSLGDGTFTADLRPEWSIGSHPHGGFLLALLGRTARAWLVERGELAADPLVVSTEFLRAPAVGPVLLRVDERKFGRRTVVLAIQLEQRGRSCVEATVTAGRLPMRRPEWAQGPSLPARPPAEAIELGAESAEGAFSLATVCEVWLDPATAAAPATRGNDQPRVRLWARPRHGDVDPYFALLAADINPPVVANLGHVGWAPTVQMTALVRSKPASGWLRVQVDCQLVQESWFDSDATVFDAAGRLVCQARQLALAPAT